MVQKGSWTLLWVICLTHAAQAWGSDTSFNPMAPASKPFHYYTSISASSRVSEGINVTTWEGGALGALDLAFGRPFLTLARWLEDDVDGGPRGLPAEGSFWLPEDALYVVLDGRVHIAVQGSHAAVLERGDAVWVRAGTVQQALRPSEGTRPEVMVIGGRFQPMLVSSSRPPPFLLPETSSFGDLSARLYLGRQATWFDDSHVGGGGAVCGGNGTTFPPGSQPENGQGACDSFWAPQTSADPSLFRVHWAPNQKLAAHYHAQGALYLPLWGRLCFIGERCIGKGEARWVRPGYRYEGEYTEEDATEILVLNVDTPANFDDDFGADRLIVAKRKTITFTVPGPGAVSQSTG